LGGTVVRLTVVVPAYQEHDRIAEAVGAIRSALRYVDGGVEVVVVDDGSTDGTAAAARASGADQVLVHDVNRGKGAAVRTGVLASNGRTVAFTDADLAYEPEQLRGLLDKVESGVDVVVGSRKHEGTRTLVQARRLREIGGRVINWLTHAVLLGNYRDTQCGLKAFDADAARLIFSRSRVDRFAFDVEIFVIAEKNHLSVEEVPVTIANSTRSTVHVVRETARLVRDLFRIRRWSRRGVYE
jgi:glycosyltransferase involved in cell wall biosynthesis